MSELLTRLREHIEECDDLVSFHRGTDGGPATVRAESDDVAALELAAKLLAEASQRIEALQVERDEMKRGLAMHAINCPQCHAAVLSAIRVPKVTENVTLRAQNRAEQLAAAEAKVEALTALLHTECTCRVIEKCLRCEAIGEREGKG
jgi:hypothetical protein